MPVKFILFDLNEDLVNKWREAYEALVSEGCRQNVSIIHSALDDIPKPFDCIVSPANSFGRFDGGFDQILSDSLAPPTDPDALTRTAQSVLYARWRGFAPPGTCTLIPLSDTPCAGNAFRCRFVALCPTMRTPASVTWHREIVYNCVWSLLVAIDEHNSRIGDEGGGKIETVVLTGLATGVGRVPAAVCAKQTALAFAHFHEATVGNPEKWKALEWHDIGNMPLNRRLPMDE
ncbi:hypothetical protein C8T65DRAFT_711381 [Cerioporus squamosus]|nr:hypothetical protein C8T65DRAFT_711381 [Cerioporus squamosus]